MKNKIVIFSILLTTITSSFAITGKGYKILREEIHSAPGFNFHVEDVPSGMAEAQKKKDF